MCILLVDYCTLWSALFSTDHNEGMLTYVTKGESLDRISVTKIREDVDGGN